MSKIRNLLVSLISMVMFTTSMAMAVPTDIAVKVPVDLRNTLAADAADFVWTACDTVNGNSITLTGRELVLVNNSGASPYTVTVTSVKDELGRTGDNPNAYSMAAGEFAVFGPYPNRGWAQTTGKLHFTASNVAVKFAIIRLPASY